MGGAGGDQFTLDGNNLFTMPCEPTLGARGPDLGHRDAAGIFIRIDIGDGEGAEY